MKLLHIVFLLFNVHATTSLQENKKENLTAIRRKARNFYAGLTRSPTGVSQERRHFPTNEAIPSKHIKAVSFRNLFNKDWGILPRFRRKKQGKDYRPSVRRSYRRNRKRYASSSVRDSSTSAEMKAWKEEFDEERIRLKQEAVAIKHTAPPHGDVVHMMAARPWTAPCGDPQQHDWAWGTCTLNHQCDGEYRIYRGDIYCGRTALVCCSVQITAHDLYQGFDLSFEDTGTESSGEQRNIDLGSKRLRRNKKYHQRIRRWRKRQRTKRVIKKKIRNLVHALRKTLNRAFRNTTVGRKRKVEELQRFIKKMKTKLRHERNVAKHKFEIDIAKIHSDLYKKLVQLDSVNAHFLVNETFREFLKRYNISGSELRSLNFLNPKLLEYLARTTFSDGLQQILAVVRSNIAINSQNENRPLSDKQVLRSLDEKQIKADNIPDYVSVYDKLSQRHDLRLFPEAPLRFDFKSSAEAVVDSLPPTQGPTTLGNIHTGMQSYIEIEKNIPEDVRNDTRRSGTNFIFKRKPPQKIPKRKDYLEYDIEYGTLYL